MAGPSRAMRWRQGGSRRLDPAAHPRLVVEIGVAEFAFQISLLTGNDAVADDEIEHGERHERPKAVDAAQAKARACGGPIPECRAGWRSPPRQPPATGRQERPPVHARIWPGPGNL